MKKKHKIILSVVSLFVAACIGVGLYLAHKNQEFQNEMFRIVHSEEVRELIEEDLKRKDPNALTENGKIRSYKIDDGKLTSTGDDLGKVGSKINDGDLTWKQLNLNNKVHDKDAAKAVADKFFAVGLGGGIDSMLGIFAYSSDFSKHIRDAQLGLTVVPMSLAEITDIYNAATPDTYNADQVYKKVPALKQAKYREIDDSYKGNESKYNKSIGNAEVLYFKKDKMYLAAFGGIGGASGITLTTPDKWIEEGDRIIIPLINNFEGGKIKGKIVLRLNNKQYEGGQSRSKYYIESRTDN